MRDYAFQVLGLPCLVSLIRHGNFASRRVAEKVGLRFKRHHARWRGILAVCVLPQRYSQTRHQLIAQLHELRHTRRGGRGLTMPVAVYNAADNAPVAALWHMESCEDKEKNS